ncbi:MAG: tetratricopeptide repeat protein [Bacteroidia bacterium]|nr:tetratricopeptide repeat protein [Bacteroidia bacterium]
MKFLLTLFFTCFIFFLHAQYPTRSTNPEALASFQSGERLWTARDYREAQNFFRKAVSTDGNFVDAYNRLAESFRMLDLIDSTILYYQKSLEVYPRGLKAHQDLAAAFQIKGDYQAAIDQYKELLRHYPDYPQAYYGMALVHFNQRQFPETIRTSEAAMRIFLSGKSFENASDARMLAGQAYMNTGDYEKAVQYFKASKKQMEDKPYYHYYLGFCYLRMGNKDKASENLAQAEVMGYKIPVNIKDELKN